MTTLLTFLGTTPYKETTYVLADKRYETCFCPAAVAHICEPEHTLVVVTQAAKARHYEDLADEIAPDTKPVAVEIPDGHSEADLWQIFDQLTDHIGQGEELIVDITYGFRSLPFLSFLALAFLQVAKDATVKAVYYGAWDARTEDNETPIFDLTLFVTLLDWTVATDQFLATGDSDALAHRLQQSHQLPWKSKNRATAYDLPTNLKSTAGILDKMGNVLRLVRPEDVMETAAALGPSLAAVEDEAGTWAKPFSLLMDRTANDYTSLAFDGDPRDPANLRESLAKQRVLVEWYVKRRQYVQAIVLAREWIVSYATFLLDWDLLHDRKAAEKLLNVMAHLRREEKILRMDSDNDEALGKAVALWNKLPDLRNDIAHVGMRRDPRSVASILKAAEALPADLATLPLPSR
ncbi:MAG: TIGR02221 family CRISPR-associated protein [Chloroflexota bacterium]|nr:TIGR02221 family CRISPR-associated protein [Chloroflexota bacterium]